MQTKFQVSNLNKFLVLWFSNGASVHERKVRKLCLKFQSQVFSHFFRVVITGFKRQKIMQQEISALENHFINKQLFDNKCDRPPQNVYMLFGFDACLFTSIFEKKYANLLRRQVIRLKHELVVNYYIAVLKCFLKSCTENRSFIR